jgi:hypothetical protein
MIINPISLIFPDRGKTGNGMMIPEISKDHWSRRRDPERMTRATKKIAYDILRKPKELRRKKDPDPRITRVGPCWTKHLEYMNGGARNTRLICSEESGTSGNLSSGDAG